MKRAGICVLGVMILAAGCVSRMAVNGNKAAVQSLRVSYSEASGDSYEEAVKITGVQKQSQGVEAEDNWIAQKHGVEGKDWKIAARAKIKEEGKVYDMIEISLISDSSMRIYYFDVSDFSWKQD